MGCVFDVCQKTISEQQEAYCMDTLELNSFLKMTTSLIVDDIFSKWELYQQKFTAKKQ
jgi:hypothetical protein